MSEQEKLKKIEEKLESLMQNYQETLSNCSSSDMINQIGGKKLAYENALNIVREYINEDSDA